MMPSYIERRQELRTRVEGNATVAQPGQAGFDCDLVDLGLRGMAVRAKHPKPEGFVRISFSVGEPATRFDIDGLVVREEEDDGGSIWAIRFLGLDPSTHARLRSFLLSVATPTG
jgi:hypothetical protein